MVRQISLIARVLTVIGLWMAVASAQAAVIIEQPLVDPDADGVLSAVDGQPAGSESADSFVVTESLILSSIQWWGVYFPEQPLPTDSFTVRIFTDAAGAPDTVPIAEATGVAPTRSDTGLFDIYAGTIFEYETTALSGILLNPGTYYLSVVNVFDPYSADWYWAQGSGGDGSNWGRDPSVSLDWYSSAGSGLGDFDLAYRLVGEVESGEVPVPATFLLALPGLLLLYRMRRA